MPFVYIVRCADGTLYVGHTADLAVREKAHNEGTAAAYTAKRRPVRVVYSEEHPTTQAAITRERQLKRWSTKKKEALIAADTKALRILAQRHRY